MTEIREAAMRYLDTLYVPIPVQFQAKETRRREWQNTKPADIDPDRDFPEPCNIGLVLGDASAGLVDIDLDCDQAIRIADRFLPDTDLTWGRPGRPESHWLYTVDNCGDRKVFNGPGNESVLVEYRANGCYSVAPPSVHVTGEKIDFVRSGQPAQVTREDLMRSVGRLAAASLLAMHWQAGERHQLALSLSGGLLLAGWPVDDVRAFIEAVCIAAQDKELEDRLRSVTDTERNIQQGKPVSGWPTLVDAIGDRVVTKVTEWLGIRFHLQTDDTTTPTALALAKVQEVTDIGAASRFIQHHKNSVCYSDGMGWMVWNGTRWAQDNDAARKLANATATRLCVEASNIVDSDERRRFIRFAQRSSEYRGITNMLDTAKVYLKAEAEQFDQKPFLLGCQNGTLDLATGRLRRPDPADWMTCQIPVAFDPAAECPRFMEFLDQIFAGDRELIRFVQKAIGYSLTGSNKEQCLFIAYGTGANGKSTLINLIANLMGPLAQTTPVETFLAKKFGLGISNDLAKLRGARFVPVAEAEAGQQLAVGLIKRITGGERIAARFLYKELFEFTPQFKVWLSTNHKPRIPGDDGAIWRRIRLIPFGVTIPEAERDPNLALALLEELPGILRWAVEGCLAWQSEGLNPPEAVRAATKAYREEMDYISQFLDERVEACDGQCVTKGQMFAEFQDWCHANGCDPISKQDFGGRLKALRYEDSKTGKIGHFWKDVRLKAPEADRNDLDALAA